MIFFGVGEFVLNGILVDRVWVEFFGVLSIRDIDEVRVCLFGVGWSCNKN